MTPQIISFAASAGLVLAAAAVSLVALWRARTILLQRPNPAPAGANASDTAMDLLHQKLDVFQRELQDLRQQAQAASASPIRTSTPRAGMNLEKRSEALRMHRRGASSDQIAAALDLPLQEIELLLKVHRIVLSTI